MPCRRRFRRSCHRIPTGRKPSCAPPCGRACKGWPKFLEYFKDFLALTCVPKLFLSGHASVCGREECSRLYSARTARILAGGRSRFFCRDMSGGHVMNRVIAITACALTLAGCAGAPDWMPNFELPRGAPASTTMQFESEPAGAEAKTSLGQACRTPCSMSVPASEFTVTFTQPGFQPQTVPVRVTQPDPTEVLEEAPSPRLVPNPVYAELVAAPPPPTRRRATTQARPKPAAAARPTPAASRPAPAVVAPAPPPAPAPAPASPWPPVQR
jgi:hypothetical protein